MDINHFIDRQIAGYVQAHSDFHTFLSFPGRKEIEVTTMSDEEQTILMYEMGVTRCDVRHELHYHIFDKTFTGFESRKAAKDYAEQMFIIRAILTDKKLFKAFVRNPQKLARKAVDVLSCSLPACARCPHASTCPYSGHLANNEQNPGFNDIITNGG